MSDKNKILNFVPLSKKDGKNTRKDEKLEEGVAETGNFGKLKYTVFKRGNLHIYDEKKNLTFKKDCGAFEDQIEDMNLDSLTEGESKTIKGCGDNDTLVFTCAEGDIKISLEKRKYSMLTKLRKLIKKGK
jgi:hypothetical protein